MSDSFETMWNGALEAFDQILDGIGSDTGQEKVIASSGSVMGFSVLVPAHSDNELIGMKNGLQAAKDAFMTEIWRLFELKETVDREKWENEMIAALNESLESSKYYGDCEDEELEGHNTALDKVKEKIPAFVKGVEI